MESCSAPEPAIPAPLMLAMLVYGGLVCVAGVLGTKLVALGPLAVEGGIGAFLLLVAIASAVSEVYGTALARRLVLMGFVPLTLSILLIRIVLLLPAPAFWSGDAARAFPLVLGQGSRMMAAGIAAYGVSQLANLAVLRRLRATGVRFVWLRTLIAGVASQILDTLVFITVAFAGVAPLAPLFAGQIVAKLALTALVIPLCVEAIVWVMRR